MPEFFHQGRLHFTDTAKGEEAVVLLHGLGSRASDWQPQIEALAPQYRVVALDFPGHGNSDPLVDPVSMADLASRVCLLLDHLELESAHVVGLSLGGMVGFQLAADAPVRVKSLTVINSAPGPGAQKIKFKFQLALRKLVIHALGLQRLATSVATKLFPSPQQEALRQQFLASVAACDSQSYAYTVDAIGNFDLADELESIHVPVLVLAADQDYTSVDFKQQFCARLPDARLYVIPNSRHASPLDNPEFCNHEIIEFLSRHASPRMDTNKKMREAIN